MMKKYKEVLVIPMTVIGVMRMETHMTKDRFDSLKVFNASPGGESLNSYLKEGYEVIEFTAHFSKMHDSTGIVAIIGKM